MFVRDLDVKHRITRKFFVSFNSGVESNVLLNCGIACSSNSCDIYMAILKSMQPATLGWKSETFLYQHVLSVSF